MQLFLYLLNHLNYNLKFYIKNKKLVYIILVKDILLDDHSERR